MTTASRQRETGAGIPPGSGGRRSFGGFERVWEILLIAVVAPTVFYGIQSLNNLPAA